MSTLKRPDGSLELRCATCGMVLIVPMPSASNADLVCRVEKLELAVRAATADVLDYAKLLHVVEERVSKLEGGKVE
jgi:hypothetical protein